MAIQQQKKQSDLEKRLQLLRRQVYGKTEKASYSASKLVNNTESLIAQALNSGVVYKADISFLYQDLLKIGIFATIALSLQIILFFLSRNQIINLNFF